MERQTARQTELQRRSKDKEGRRELGSERERQGNQGRLRHIYFFFKVSVFIPCTEVALST